MYSVQISSIPTISSLYENGNLQPSDSSDSTLLSTPSATLNNKISLIRTSITTLATTCIVNAANESLLGGGGVDGAIHAAAGPSLLAECSTLNGCKTGSAKITSAYELPSKYIIHAVGPIYARAKRHSHLYPAELLTSCYRTALELAAEKGGSVAFSCLSTGVYGYPSGEAAEVACKEVRRFLEREEGKRLERVVFCCFEAKDEKAYGVWLPKIFPPPHSTSSLSEPPPKRSKTTSASEDNDDKDWEAVDKPSEAPSEGISEKTTDISEEGEEVEAPDLGADDGEKVERPAVRDELAESGEVVPKPKSGLLKDW